jgi:fibronectin-binding autotransporter adhesin
MRCLHLRPSLRAAVVAAGLVFLPGTDIAWAQFSGTPITFNNNGGWCWFQDPRAIIDNGQLIIGTIAGFTGSGSTGGDVDVTSYSFQSQTSTETLLQSAFDQDDHACPAFTVLPDGRIMVVYATHGGNNDLQWRVSTSPGETTSWSAEQTGVVNTANDGNGNTYSNPFYLSTPNEVVNFSRAIGYDPNYSMFSNLNNTDNTVSSINFAYGGHWMYWQNPGTGPLTGGDGRPYVKYASNGTNTVWFAATEDSPQNYLNSLYVGYVQFNNSGAGTVYTSTGGSLGGLSTGTAPTGNGGNPPVGGNQGDIASGSGLSYLPTDFTPIVKANAVYNGIDLTGKYVGWATSMQLDSSGKPYLGFVVVDNTTGAYGNDLEYYYAHLVGNSWEVSRVGYAGYPLYNGQNQYAGLMAVDPTNPNTIYFSADVNPATGASLLGPDGHQHYQILEGTTNNGGSSWTWNQITDTSSDNIRPEVVAGSGKEALVWMQGSYTSYTSFNTSMVGLVETIPNIWTGTGTVFDSAANWTNGLPSTNGGVGQFNGTQTGNLTLTYTGGLAGSTGDAGLSLNLTNSQSGSVTIYATSASALCFDGINLAAGAGALTLGNGGGTQLTISFGSSSAAHLWTNNSSNTATINSDVAFQTGGAANQTLVLGGSGNWTFNNSITSLNSVLSLSSTGSGFTTLTGSSSLGSLLVSGGGTLAANGALNVASSVTVNGATLAGAGSISGNTLLSGNGAINLSGGTIGGTLVSTGGNWNGTGAVAGLVTVSSNVFTIGSGATLGASSGLTVAGGATLAGSGTIAGGTVTLNAGAILAPGNNATTGNVGTLNLPNIVLSGSETAYFDLSGTTTTAGNGANDLVHVAGNLTLGGTTSVYVNLINGTSLVSGGTYNLFSYTGSALGAAASSALSLADPGVLSGRQSYHFDTSHAGDVNLDITGGPANLNWVGSNAASWDNSGGTANWFNTGTSQSDRFYAGDFVNFTSSRSGTVSINAAVQPGSVAVSGNYTFSGTGKITGATSLTVQSGGTLVLANTNDYAGNTTIDQGTLQIAAVGAIPAGAGAGYVVFDNAANRAVLDLNGLSAAINGLSQPSPSANNLVVNNLSGTGTLSVGANNASSTFAGILANNSGAGGTLALTKIGSGMLTLAGSNAYTGPTIIGGGTLALGTGSPLSSTTTLAFSNTTGAAVFNLSGNNQTIAAATFPLSGAASAAITGGGTLAVGAPAGFAVAPTGNAASLTVDMSGLATFVYNNSGGTFSAGGSADGVATGAAAVLSLARTNTITAAFFGVAPFLANSNIVNTGTVQLGQMNVIDANTILVGGIKTDATLAFQPLTDPTLRIRGAAGGTSRAAVTVATDASGQQATTGAIDLTANVVGSSTLDAMISTLTVGQDSGKNSMPVTGVFNMAGGTLDAQTIILASTSGTGGGATVSGEFGLSGGLVESQTLTLADKRGPNSASAVFDLDGGTLSAALIQSGSSSGTRTFNWNNGTIANYNGSGGTAGLTVSVPALTMAASGTHTLWIDYGWSGTIGSAIGGQGLLTKNGGGTAILSGSNNYTGGTEVLDGTLLLDSPSAIETGTNLYVGFDASIFISAPDGTAVPAATSLSAATVPEPGTFALLGVAGAIGLLVRTLTAADRKFRPWGLAAGARRRWKSSFPGSWKSQGIRTTTARLKRFPGAWPLGTMLEAGE